MRERKDVGQDVCGVGRFRQKHVVQKDAVQKDSMQKEAGKKDKDRRISAQDKMMQDSTMLDRRVLERTEGCSRTDYRNKESRTEGCWTE